MRYLVLTFWLFCITSSVPAQAAELADSLRASIARLDESEPRSKDIYIRVIALIATNLASPYILDSEDDTLLLGFDTVQLQLLNRGAVDIVPLPQSGQIAFTASRDVLEGLQDFPEIDFVREDMALLEAPLAMHSEPGLLDWNLSMVGAPRLWQMGYQGSSVTIAVLDTGVDGDHPILSNSFRGGAGDWFDPYGEHQAPYDRTGHGTQVTGLLVGMQSDGTALGVAPHANWIAAKVFNDAGEATESSLHAVFEWLLDPDGDPATDDAPDVVNASWGISEEGLCNEVFVDDLNALRNAGISIVFSAGNLGPTTATDVSPANNENTVSVGAITEEGLVASFSSRGPSSCHGGFFPVLVAPGDGVLTTDHSFGGNEITIYVAGTSFAAPHVTGALALLKDAVPPAAMLELEEALKFSAVDAASEGADNDTGYGLLNIPAALDFIVTAADDDNDGFSVTIDCDDNNPNIYPGARDRRNDGIDQDCNGFDMTIQVHYAVYSHDGGSLNIRATSRLDERAQLEIVGVGPMTYRAIRDDWIYEGGGIDGYSLRRITIRGIEGELRVRPRPPMPTRS